MTHEIVKAQPRRWLMAIAAAAVMATIGTVYSWGMFTQPLLAAFQWDVTVTTTAFAIANFFLAAVGAVAGGFWQDKVGPRPVAITGVALWGVGNLLTGLGTPSLGAPWLYLTYGVIGGIGAGIAYVTPLAMVTKWFPDKKGLASGLVVGGFGLGAFGYNQIVPCFDSFHSASVHAAGFIAARNAARDAGVPFDPTTLAPTVVDIAAVMHVFEISGIVFLAVGLAAASFFRNPPEDYNPVSDAPVGVKFDSVGYSPSQVLATPQFYLLWLMLFVNVIGGIAIISNAVFILADLTGLSAGMIAPLFGMLSIFNAIGRFFWGAVSDRIGPNNTFATMFAVQSVALLLLSEFHGLTAALVGFSVILLCFGGGFGTMPSFNTDYFGTKYMGRNYGLILSAWGFAGLIGPVLVARVKDVTGSFAGMLPIIAIVLALAIPLPFLTKKPEPEPEPAPLPCGTN